jgi:hypothetical protein
MGMSIIVGVAIRYVVHLTHPSLRPIGAGDAMAHRTRSSPQGDRPAARQSVPGPTKQ